MTAGLGGGQNPGYRPVIFVSYHRGAVHLYFVVVYNEKQAWLRKIRAATRKISAPLLSARPKRKRPPMSSGGRRSH
jgi:hypothetical protein